MAVVGVLWSLRFTPRESPGEVGKEITWYVCTVMSAAGTLIGQHWNVGPPFPRGHHLQLSPPAVLLALSIFQ